MFSFEFYDEAIVVSTSGIKRINFLNVAKLQNLIFKLSKNKCHRILLNLEDISFIDSQAFRKLVSLSKKMARFGVQFKFVNLNDDLKEIVELIPEAGFLIEVKSPEEVAEFIGA